MRAYLGVLVASAVLLAGCGPSANATAATTPPVGLCIHCSNYEFWIVNDDQARTLHVVDVHDECLDKWISNVDVAPGVKWSGIVATEACLDPQGLREEIINFDYRTATPDDFLEVSYVLGSDNKTWNTGHHKGLGTLISDNGEAPVVTRCSETGDLISCSIGHTRPPNRISFLESVPSAPAHF
jgi:hypothetical protein